MPKYRVNMTQTISCSVVVEADDEEHALNEAIEYAPQTDFAFSEFDAGEWNDNDKAEVFLCEPGDETEPANE